MNKKTKKKLKKRKKKIQKRITKNQVNSENKPVFSATNIHYDLGGRINVIPFGGIGQIHIMQHNLGLDDLLNDKLNLLKQHRPYMESDHIFNIAYCILTGGDCLEDIEMLRQNDTYMDALGAPRIPDPTTAGDFLRRFDSKNDLLNLMMCINEIRQKVWNQQPEEFFKKAYVDVDGTMVGTSGECKEGMDISYNGIWGYHPLIITFANTGEHLFIVNRSGNRPSHDGAAEWIDRTIDLLKPNFLEIVFRGDTDFSLTKNFDRWDENSTFYFGFDAMPNLVKIAEGLDNDAWEPMGRSAKYKIKTRPRKKKKRVKDKIVKERKFKRIRTVCEHVAEFSYSPTKCEKTYRVVVLKKDLLIERGEEDLFGDIRFFFYITNDWESSKQTVVKECNKRCDQENKIEQSKNGVPALKAPSDTLFSNWAWMIIASLAWTLKAWYGLLSKNKREKKKILRMEFKKFRNAFMNIPVQIIKGGRRILYRILGYNAHLKTFFKNLKRVRRLRV